jgi:hypothetical protein
VLAREERRGVAAAKECVRGREGGRERGGREEEWTGEARRETRARAAGA